jgi:branched-chain amino acid transport system substrate-binding protein
MAILLLLVMTAAGFATRQALDLPPIRLAFIGSLTGRGAELSQASRDGAQFAVDECNEVGGISGSQVQLLIRDDHEDPERLPGMFDELERNQVLAAIGPMTSSMAVRAAELAPAHSLLLIGPNSSGNDLAKRDDMFFRVYPGDAQTMDHLARYVRLNRKYRRAFIILDNSNAAHTVGAAATFAKTLVALDGVVAGRCEFTSGSTARFEQLATTALAAAPDCILVLANACDTAMVCQQLRKLNSRIPVCTGEWAATDDILSSGGSSVEGVFFFNTFDRGYAGERYRAFHRRFLKRFGYEPGFASVHAYDAARILLMAISSPQYQGRADLKPVLLTIRSFEGLQGRISFDDSGDVRRELYLTCIRDGAFRGVQ